MVSPVLCVIVFISTFQWHLIAYNVKTVAHFGSRCKAIFLFVFLNRLIFSKHIAFIQMCLFKYVLREMDIRHWAAEEKTALVQLFQENESTFTAIYGKHGEVIKWKFF